MTASSTAEQATTARRWAGVLTLAVVLLAAVVIPQVSGTRVAGTAHIAPAPAGPPAVGECLLQSVPSDIAALNQKLIYPAVATGQCRGHRYGEVVAVIASANRVPASLSDGGTEDPNMSTCLNATTRYLGRPARLSLGGGWETPSVTATLAAGPTLLQRSAGQNWIACIEYLNSEAPGHFHTNGYYGTTMHAFNTGLPPAEFATCLRTAASAEPAYADCHQPHPAELFATAAGSASTSRLLLTNTCTVLVSQYTRMPTVTNGQLTVEINVYDQSGTPVPDSAATVAGYTATCIAVPTQGRQLTGPLMGLGDKPVPLQ